MSISERVRAGVLDETPPREEAVETPWGPVVVREMSGDDFDLFLEALKKHSVPADQSADGDGTPPEPQRVRSAAVVFACTRDPDTGERVFTMDDVPKLARRPVGRWFKMYEAADKLSDNVRPADAADAETLGESKGGPSAGGGSPASSGSQSAGSSAS